MWEVVSPGGEADLEHTYRTTYFFSGTLPPAWLRLRVFDAVRFAAKTTNRFKVVAQDFFTPEQTAGFPGKPVGAARPWAFRVTWKKIGEGTPLAFFMGPSGLLTIAIIGVIVVTAGAVVLGRTVERSANKLGDQFRALFSPGSVIATMVIVAVIYASRRK